MHLNVREASRLLRVSESRIHQWIRRGVLRANRVNDRYHLHRSDLLEQTSSGAVDVRAEIFADLDSAAEPPVMLGEALRAGGIFPALEGGNKSAVLREIFKVLALPPDSDRESLLQLLMAREAMGSTAIGGGIAIPHVRRPLLLGDGRPSLSLCLLRHPVDFAAPDGLPVHAIFVIIAPTSRAHLRLLSKLSVALHDSTLRAALTPDSPPQSILREFERIDSASSASLRDPDGE
jgi:PTS system nitrogen regulatory IIA component